MNMYEKIKSLCDEKGIKIATVCKEAGVPKSTLSELKNGRTKKLSTTTLSKLSNYFGVSIGFFDDGSETVDGVKDELFEKRKLLFDMSQKATKEQLDTFIVMFKALIDNESENM